jgi:hypothetical protein
VEKSKAVKKFDHPRSFHVIEFPISGMVPCLMVNFPGIRNDSME